MKRSILLKLISVCLLTLTVFFNARAQKEATDDQKPAQPMRPMRILKELELTREQIQQIRRINAQRQPIIQAATRNLREASRALDVAIYADAPNEEEIQAKMKDVQAAQAELLKARTMTEFMIRKVLTPEQLEKFRQMRLRQIQDDQPKRPFREQRWQNRPN